nr:integrase, catalytic region, zinc finger, CCHC-type, peptidase aspartic, catalytic [Tanacetum cinerariifolium]
MSDPTSKPSDALPSKIEAPKELPKISLVNESLKKLKFHRAKFDNVVKIRTTPNTRTECEWGFEHIKVFFNNEIIPFQKSLKDIFNVFDRDLQNEIMKVQTIFDQIDAAVQQSSVDKQSQLQDNDSAICKLTYIIKSLREKSKEENVNYDYGMFKLDLEPLAPKLFQNREAHIDYLKYTQEQADILQRKVEQDKAKHPLDNALDFAYQSLCNKKNDKISQTPSRIMKNKVEAQPRNVNKKNYVFELIHNVDAKQSQLNANFKLMYATCKKSMFDDVHDLCILDFVKNVNSRAKFAKKHKKTKYLETYRITSANVVPPKKTTSHLVETQKPELKVYSRKPKNVKNVGSSKKAKIVESKNANHLEPNHTWGSNATYIPSSSSLVVTGCPDCSLVSRLRMFKTYDREPLSAYELCKSKKSSHQPKAEDTNHEKLYLLQLNLYIPMRVASINRKMYILVIVDDYSRFTCLLHPNHSLIRLQYNKNPYELMQDKKPNLSFFHVFGALCYPTNENDDLGKLDAKTDIGIFIGYAPAKKAFKIYNKRTQKIIETIHVTLNELTAMASEQFSLGPELQCMIPATSSSGFILNPVSQQPCIPPNRDEWDHLFQPMFDEYFNPQTIVISLVPVAVAPRAVYLSDSPVLTSIDQDAPSASIPSTQEHSLSIPHNFEES